MTTPNSPPSALPRRFVEMGLSQTLPAFPADGVPLVLLAPWWRLWPRDPRHNLLESFGAAVFPAAASGAVTLRQNAPIPQALFAALLPLHQPSTAVADWTGWTIGASSDRSYSGPGPLLGVLEHLLQKQPEREQVEVWSRILECCLDREGEFRGGPADQGVALLETIGRSGLRALAPRISCVLQNKEPEFVLAAIACLTRLGVPDAEMPAEVLLNRLRPEMVDRARWALAFAETGDADLLDGLLRVQNWCERVQCLRLEEAVLIRWQSADRPREGWLDNLLDLLLVQLQQEEDRDVVRCLAVPLGLALRRCGEAPLGRTFEAAARLTDKARFECLLNALLVGELPASAASRVEDLRRQAVNMDSRVVRAVNRVLMSLGEPSGTVRDWLGAAHSQKPKTLQVVGALMAGAASDCAITPVELRCCLGHAIGGPLAESPAMVGQLLGLLVTQDKEIRQSAEELLLLTSPGTRIVAGCCLRWMERSRNPFGEDRQRWSRFGVPTLPFNHASALAEPLQPLFAELSPACPQPEHLLEALALSGDQSSKWIRQGIDWTKPEAVRTTFDGTDSTKLAASFLQASASPHTEARQIAGLLAAGIGSRLAEASHRDRIIQRVICLAAHDSDADVRQAGHKAAESLGIVDRVPTTPTPAPPKNNNDQGPAADAEDQMLEQLLQEMGNHTEVS